jgi:hypothetical protein
VSILKATLALGIAASCGASVLGLGQFQTSAREQTLAYSKTAATDPVARLQQRIDKGEVTLSFDENRGYLPAVLEALGVPTASQGLVFSRTSLQVDRIAPWSPRAIYFADDVYVGWVPGGAIVEVASVDPQLGGVFYSLTQERTDKPTFARDDRTCLQCHDSTSSTGGVPGFIMRSVIADRHGYPVATDAGATNDSTPLGKRWGGWYVTGGLGALEHMGNVMVPALRGEMGNVQQYLARTPTVSTGGVRDLTSKFDTSQYLTGHSDAIALLVLAHQTSVHNLITSTRYEAVKAAAQQSGAESTLTLPVRGSAERLVRAMLFANEAHYPGRVTGTSEFERQFPREGPRDRKGRSLREFDLERRLFKYPFSYLIYSEAFDAIPDEVKRFIGERIRTILSGEDTSPDFAHLSADDRAAILEILQETKPALFRK